MATVIDALVVELGLDPKNFVHGEKATVESIDKTKKATERSATDAEKSSRRVQEATGKASKETKAAAKADAKAAEASNRASAKATKERKASAGATEKAAKDKIASTRKVTNETQHSDKIMEDSGRRLGSFLSQLRNQMLGVLAAFTAGMGLKDFVKGMTSAEVETGFLSHTLETTIPKLSAWRGAAGLFGGTAEGITASVQNLVSEFQNFRATGQSSIVPYFYSLGVSISDAQGKMRSFDDILLDLSDKFKSMDPAQAAWWGRQMGFDQGTINLLLQGRNAIKAVLAEQAKLGVITEADAKAGLALSQAWIKVGQSSASAGRAMLTDLGPVLTSILSGLQSLSEWAGTHLQVVEAGLVAITAVVVALGGALGLYLTASTFSAIASGFALVTTFASEAMLALAVLAETTLPALSGVFLAVGAAIEATPIGWIITGIAAIAAGAFLIYKNWGSLKGFFASIFGGMVGSVGSILSLIKSLFVGSADDIRTAWSNIFTGLAQMSVDWFTALGNIGAIVVKSIEGAGPAIFNAFKSAFASSIAWIEGRFAALWDLITGHKSPAPPKAQEPAKPPARPADSPQVAKTAPQAAPEAGKAPQSPAARPDRQPPANPSRAQAKERAWEAAQASEQKYGIPAKVTYAQWALESDYGTKMPAGSNNPFGIKARKDQPAVEAMTNENVNGRTIRLPQKFAKYDSIEEAFDAHGKLLSTLPVYARARSVANDPNAYADSLQGRYATDPHYAVKLKTIMREREEEVRDRPPIEEAGRVPSNKVARATPQPGPKAVKGDRGLSALPPEIRHDEQPPQSQPSIKVAVNQPEQPSRIPQAESKPQLLQPRVPSSNDAALVAALNNVSQGLGALTLALKEPAVVTALTPVGPSQVPPSGSKQVSAINSVANDNSRTTTTHVSTDTKIGQIIVQAGNAHDAKGVARELGSALKRDTFAAQANYGQA